MNLRTKFFWYSLLIIGLITIPYFGWELYKIYEEKSELWATYDNEATGTDKILSEKVREMEAGFQAQQDYKFKISDIPTDLTKVIALDGLDFSGYGVSSVRFSAGIAASKNYAIGHYHDQIYHITAGDSIAGGVVTSVTATQVTFERDGDIFTHILNPQPLTNN